MGAANSQEKLERPGDPLIPCLAILSHHSSELMLLNLDGESSDSIKISDHECLGIVTIGGEVYAVTRMEILKLHSDGTKSILRKLRYDFYMFSKIVLFQKKIYIIEPNGESMSCFDPADNSLIDDFPRCWLRFGFCAFASDDFIYAIGGDLETGKLVVKYDPLTRMWDGIALMGKVRDNAAAAILDGKIYVMGGWMCGASAEYYNPADNCWTEISNMTIPRYDFSVCVIENQLYAVGGNKDEEGLLKYSIEVYDGNEWTVVTVTQDAMWDPWTYSCFWPHGSYRLAGGQTSSV